MCFIISITCPLCPASTKLTDLSANNRNERVIEFDLTESNDFAIVHYRHIFFFAGDREIRSREQSGVTVCDRSRQMARSVCNQQQERRSNQSAMRVTGSPRRASQSGTARPSPTHTAVQSSSAALVGSRPEPRALKHTRAQPRLVVCTHSSRDLSGAQRLLSASCSQAVGWTRPDVSL